MFKRRSDLPFDNDATSHFLPTIVAVMVFLAVLATTGAMVIQDILERWHRDVSGTVTVQVGALASDSLAEVQQRVDAAITVLQNTPGIAAARPLDQREIADLLEPWLGSTELVADLPLPRLIDVTLRKGATVDMNALTQRLAETVPATSLNDHQVWLSKLVRLGRGLEVLALSVVAMVIATTAVAVAHATHSALAIHHSVIEVLHIVGAHDDYIARQFAHLSLIQGLRGGFWGLMLAVPVLGIIGWLASHLESGLLPAFVVRPFHLVSLGLLPLGMAGLAQLTARITVHRTLARMP
ncbi:MAG: cell division transport system permease protein [Rhodospirillaceae bacterium]|nr:MAG: cell division transport system permease protein [Rhodospirillaceae bacterium]